MGRNKNVTPDEVQYVRTNCMVKSIAEMATELHRSYWTIHRVLQKLGVRKSHKFTAMDDSVIKQMYGKFTAKSIASKLGIDVISVYNRAKKLDLQNRSKRQDL